MCVCVSREIKNKILEQIGIKLSYVVLLRVIKSELTIDRHVD